MEHQWERDENGKFICRFNNGCHCDLPTCGCCGWNPEVARRRTLEFIKKKGAKKDESNSCPCKGCTERFKACSDRCPKDARGEYGYNTWKAAYRKEQAAEREYNLRRREDWMRSEQRAAGQDRFIKSKIRMRGVSIHGRK